jgi:hypothetical protein
MSMLNNVVGYWAYIRGLVHVVGLYKGGGGLYSEVYGTSNIPI